MVANRFDYIQYDEQATAEQERFKAAFKNIEEMVDLYLISPRAKALVHTNLEQAYMWVGKAIRDDQIARHARNPL